MGIRLGSSTFDRVQSCDNHCEFCFIYLPPPGLRQSLYLKADDCRLSFLYGNFTTSTRFTELDLARVVEERLGPLNVSIHATDPEVRARMLRNPRGATSLRWLRAHTAVEAASALSFRRDPSLRRPAATQQVARLTCRTASRTSCPEPPGADSA